MMDAIKKTALKRALITITVVVITGYYRLNSYLLSGDVVVWVSYILIVIGVGALTYFASTFKLKDIRRSEKLTADEYFEMHKRRIKFFLFFCFIMSIILVIIFDLMTEYLGFEYILMMILFFWVIVILLVIGWYQGIKKVVKIKQKENGF